MEANWRIQRGIGEKVQLDFASRREAFVEQCCKAELKSKKVVFYSFGTYSDHGKYISEQLVRLREDLDIVWLVNDVPKEEVEGVRFVLVRHWAKYIYEIETAKVWVFNVEVPEFIKKRPEQIFIQAKHWASVTLKRCYLDSVTLKDSPHYNNWRRNGKLFDYMLTGSQFDTAFCRRAFEFDKECVQVGSPRSDAVFRGDENRKKIQEYFKMDAGKHILMYAPTFRFREGQCWRHRAPEMELNFSLLKDVLQERWGGEWCILLRLHPNVAKESKELKVPEYVIDVSEYSDSQELVAASDIVISDYSSIMFEPSFVKKPVFLFATDRANYIDKEYDLLIDYDSLPFPIAETNEELMRHIREFDMAAYEKNLNKFLDKYDVHEDGRSSERAAQFIAKLI